MPSAVARVPMGAPQDLLRDPTDRRIAELRALRGPDGQALSLRAIGRLVELSEAAVRKRLERLRDAIMRS